MSVPPGWIVFPDKQGSFWEVNTAMLVALVRAQVRAEFPPTDGGYSRLWSELLINGGAKAEIDALQSGIRLPQDMASLVDRRVDLWIRSHRDHLLSMPGHYADNVLPDLRIKAGVQNAAILPKLQDFSTSLVDHLRTTNAATASSVDKAMVESMLLEIGKMAIITGVMVLPVGWAAALVVGGALAAGGYRYYQTGSSTDAVMEGMLLAASAVPGVKGAGVGMKLVAIGSSGTLGGVQSYRVNGDVGAAVISGSGQAVVAMIGLSSDRFASGTLKALRAGQISSAEARTSMIVLSGFRKSAELGSGTMTGIVEGRQLDEAFYGATLNTLSGAATDAAGKRVARTLAGRIAPNTVLASVVTADKSRFRPEFEQKLVTRGLQEAATTMRSQVASLLAPASGAAAGSPFVFAADAGRQTLAPQAFVRSLVLRRAP